jgi:hypothetical protein
LSWQEEWNMKIEHDIPSAVIANMMISVRRAMHRHLLAMRRVRQGEVRMTAPLTTDERDTPQRWKQKNAE